MKRILMTAGVAVLALATVVSAQGYTFSTNLTVGSTGADVSTLQSWLIANGYSIPAISSGAAAKGYFGSQTKTAVMQFQASRGVPNTGFVGPLTRAQLNGSPAAVNNCTAGWTSATYGGVSYCLPPGQTPAPGSTPPITVNPGSITTVGAEGILTITNGPISSTNLNVGQKDVPVLVVRAQAQNSDIAVQRIQVDLGTDTRIFNKIFSKLSVKDSNGAVLATVPLVLNQTVVNSGNNYYVNLVGFNYIVPKGQTRDLTITADVYTAIDSTLTTAGSNSGLWKVALATSGVRGVDGAGVNLYGPGTGSTATYTDGNGTSNTLTNNTVLSSLTIASSLIITLELSSQQTQQLLLIAKSSLITEQTAISTHNFLFSSSM